MGALFKHSSCSLSLFPPVTNTWLLFNHQPAACLTVSTVHAAAPSCPLSAAFPDWSVVCAGCQTPYPELHHPERAQLSGVSPEDRAGELLSPCCTPLPHAITSPFSHLWITPEREAVISIKLQRRLSISSPDENSRPHFCGVEMTLREKDCKAGWDAASITLFSGVLLSPHRRQIGAAYWNGISSYQQFPYVP